jgi:transposase InsO family protein
MNFIQEEIFTVYGTPNEILSDNSSNLVSDAINTFLQTAGVRYRTTTPYYPQTNRKVKRFNGILGKILIQYLYSKPVTL